MKNNLLEIAKEAQKITSELLHSGYSGDMLEEIVIDNISKKLLESLELDGDNEKYRKMLMNMFMLGKLNNLK